MFFVLSADVGVLNVIENHINDHVKIVDLIYKTMMSLLLLL